MINLSFAMGQGSEKTVGASSLTDNGYTSLFDGASFEGWEGNLDYFRIKGRAIVAGSLEKDIPRNEFLCHNGSFRNFELKLLFKLTGSREHANAGIQFRSERIHDSNEVIGYQADIGQQFWGSLYDESRRRIILSKADEALLQTIVRHGDWNEYTICCLDEHIQLWLNGVKTVDYAEEDPTIMLDGRVCLQVHSGPPVEIRYRDIRIKELSSGPSD